MEHEYSTELTTQSSKALATITDAEYATGTMVRRLKTFSTLVLFSLINRSQYKLCVD